MSVFKLGTAIKKLKDGKKICGVDWQEGLYLYLDEDGSICNQNDKFDGIQLSDLADIDEEWQVFVPNIKCGIYRGKDDVNDVIFYDGVRIFGWSTENEWYKLLDRWDTQPTAVFNKYNFLDHYALAVETDDVSKYTISVNIDITE